MAKPPSGCRPMIIHRPPGKRAAQRLDARLARLVSAATPQDPVLRQTAEALHARLHAIMEPWIEEAPGGWLATLGLWCAVVAAFGLMMVFLPLMRPALPILLIAVALEAVGMVWDEVSFRVRHLRPIRTELERLERQAAGLIQTGSAAAPASGSTRTRRWR